MSRLTLTAPNHEKPQNKKEGVQKGKIPPCRIGYLISVSNRDTNKSRVPNTFWTPSHSESGKRDSNPRPPAWKASALSTELFPQNVLFLTH